jgi:ABC transporter substrate binding protein
LRARAQQAHRLPTIGFLGSGTPTTAGPWVAAFAQRLRELGWIEDRTIKIDLRWAEGRNDRSAEIVAEFVHLKVDVIVTYSTEHAFIAKQATSVIPIVATLVGDPLGTGLVTSLAHPGGLDGTRLGRRPVEESDAEKVKTVHELRAKGLGVRRIARDVGLGVGTVLRLVDHSPQRA